MIKFKNILDKNRKVIIMCSGGVDSLACLHFLHNGGWDVEAFHFRHGVKLKQVLMQNSVDHLTQWLKIPMHAKSANTSKDILATEVEMRNARYAALGEVCNLGDQVVCCHHLDDCVESYLMNTFNGSSGRLIPIHTNWGHYDVYRPFLCTEKKDLVDWVVRNNLQRFLVEDPSNNDTSFRRNFVRHKVRPLIEEQWPGLKTVVRKLVECNYYSYGDVCGREC